MGIASLTSCSLYKSYQRPDDIKTQNMYGDLVSENSEDNLAKLSWRELYTDPQLQSLIERAIANNTDVKIQEWAIEQAKASRKASKLAYLPSLSLSPEGGWNRTFGDNGSSAWTYKIPVALNWELDIFGSIYNEKKMADASLQMQKDVHQAVQARLVANIASLYYQLLALDQTKQLSEEAKKVWDDMISTSQSLMDNGVTDAISVSQFKGQGYEFEANLKSVEHSIVQTELNICALLGEPHHKIERSNILNTPSPSILRVGLSAQLLDNRPDVRQAERNLEYCYHDKNLARSNFYPKINIGAEGAYNGNFILSFFAGLTQPIFAQGKIIAQNKIAKAEYEKAKLAFQQKILDASNEVLLALSTCNTAHAMTITRVKEIGEYKRAVDYSRTRMSNGEATYLDVLTAQSNLFQKQQQLIDERLEEMLGVVNLYIALGGGYSE